MAQALVVAELQEGKARAATFSAVAAAKQAAEATGGTFEILCIGDRASSAVEELKASGAKTVYVADIEGGYLGEKYAATVAAAAQQSNATLLFATATAYGKDLMGRVAGKLQAGVASDISELKAQDGELVYRRPMYAGNAFGWLRVKTAVAIVTVRQSEFERAEASGGDSAIQTIEPQADPAAERIKFVKIEAVRSERPELAEADVVVSGGRALRSAEAFRDVLEPLVDELGAAMGASRAACDAGYVSNDLQVGQTGKVVAPKLYIAVGISGAIQHLAGIKGAKTIVAINKDREAPIAQVADYFLVEDLFTAVPALTEAIVKLKSS